MTLRCLFVDFDSFFASVEQHDDPSLLGRPVAVVPVMSATTCCIAASKEAKRDFGIKTGTGVGEALERCPHIVLKLARPSRYVELHHDFLAAIEDCIPHERPSSIDEVHCWLMGRERRRDEAVAIARRIKQSLCDAGIAPSMTCSIGIAPNRFLAKTASDMHKPDGLTVIEQTDLPDALLGLELRDLCGIGPSMEARLRRGGIDSMARLCSASREQLRRIWGSVEGERFWMQLRGVPLPERTRSEADAASVGHSHVLGPELRSYQGMRSVLFKLLAKAAMRMRHAELRASGLAIRIRFVGTERRFEHDLRFAPIDDTPTLLRLLGEALQALERARDRRRWDEARHPPLSVAVTLVGLERGDSVSGELLPQRERARRITDLLDAVNGKYESSDVLYLGAMRQAIDQHAAPMRIPFQHVPDPRRESDASHVRHAGNVRAAPTDSGQALYEAREKQFKVLAEQSHRQKDDARRKPGHRPSGAGGWVPIATETTESRPGDSGRLF